MTELFEDKIQFSKCWARAEPVVATCVLTLIACPFIFFTTFSQLPIHDDQGKLMITLREILNGRTLYHDIGGLFGPFYYLTISPVFNLFNVPLSHDATRLISATFWVCCSVSFVIFAWRLTGSAVIRGFALITVLFVLQVFSHSPLHPQELSFLLIGILLHLVIGIEKEPKPPALLLLGAIVGGLLLTKINLAAFIMLPLMLGALRATGDQAWLRAVHGVVLALGALMPVVLMGPLFPAEWAIRYCIFAGCTIVAALVVWSSGIIPKTLTIRHWAFCLVGFVTVVLLTFGATMASGTTASEILSATIFIGLVFAQNYKIPAPVSGGAIAIAAISVAYAVFYRVANREAAMACVLRLKAGMGILGCLAIVLATLLDNGSLAEVMFQCMVPFAWLLMVTNETSEQPRPLTRGILGLIAAFMVLYPFPIAGIEMSLAILLPAVMLPVLLSDAISHPSIQQLWKMPRAFWQVVRHRWRAKAMAYTLMLAMLASLTISRLRVYQSMEPLNLRGTSLVRADHENAQLIRWAVGELVKCSAFYSLPSLPSFYFWTDQRIPTAIFYDPLGAPPLEYQRLVISDLERYDGLCILNIPALLGFYDRDQLATKPPFVEYVERNFTKVESNGPFHVLHRRTAVGADDRAAQDKIHSE